MNKFVIDIRNADVFLGQRKILSNINWTVGKGEHWFILGPNGAGKTTLMRMILGYIWPKYGAEVSVLGSRFGECDISEVRRKISWVSPFLQEWTGGKWRTLEVVLSGLDGTIGLYRKVSERETEKAMRILQMLDSAKFAGSRYDMISSGEQVKTLIARALITEPEIIILDEACVHLDLKSREFLLETIGRLAAGKNSPVILFITQRIEDILPAFEKGMILKDGAIAAAGPRDEILTEKNLSLAFDIRIKIHMETDRYWAMPQLGVTRKCRPSSPSSKRRLR